MEFTIFDIKELYPDPTKRIEAKELNRLVFEQFPFNLADLKKLFDDPIEIPWGTYGEPGRTVIWAYGQRSGLRLVNERWPVDRPIIKICGATPSQPDHPDGWRANSVEGVSLSNKQFEYCYGISGFVAAYVGETLVLTGFSILNSAALWAEPWVSKELLIFSSFC